MGEAIVTRVPLALCVLFCLTLIPIASWAQQDGTINGKISDSSGAVLPGVNITVSSPQLLGGQRMLVSDEQGNYRAGLLPPATYSVKYELPGFKILVREGIQVSAGFTATLNITMEVATAAETVTVEGDSPIVDTSTASVATNFNPMAIAVIPNGHDIFSVLALTPGVQMTVPDVGGSEVRQRPSFRSYGSTSQWNVIDGAIVTSLLYQDPDSYAEMRFASASKGAESPVAGSYNTFVIKSGGNQFHGLLFADTEPLKLQSSNLSQDLLKQGVKNANSIARYRAFHADVGGPVIKDKVWWFWGMRKINSDLNLIGFTNAQTGNSEVAPTTLDNQTAKLSYQLNSRNTLSYTMQWDRKYQPYVVTAANAAFVNTNSVQIQDNPEWVQSLVLNSALTARSTMEVRFGEFGWKFPRVARVDELPRTDQTTQLVRGSPAVSTIDRSHHKNIDVVYSVNTSRGRIGTHNIKVGYGALWEGAPYTRFAGYHDNINTIWNNNFTQAAFIETIDTPFTQYNNSMQHSAFVNDSWAYRRVTFNVGVRYDAFQPWYPAQGKTGAGPYQQKFEVKEFRFHWQDAFQPRTSLIFDVFGNGKTAVKVAFGRYVYNAGSITNAASTMAGQVNPMALTTIRYSWDGTFPFVPDPSKIVRVTGGVNRRLDPNLELPYTTEYMGGIDQQLMRDMTARFTFVRKFEQNRYQLLNTAIPLSAYSIPVSFRDNGRDGSANTGDDQLLTLWSRPTSFNSLRDDLLTNDPANTSSFTTFDFEVVKRFSKKWQTVTGFDVNQYKTWRFAVANGHDIQTDTTGRAQDPNLLRFNSGLNYWHWQYKALGSYELPFGVTSSATLRITKGEPYGRTVNSSGLNQGTLSLTVEPIGTFFYPTVKIFDLRGAKSFRLGERLGKIEGIVDLFNVFNASTVLSVNTQTGRDTVGPTFGRVLQTLNPRVARLGVRWTF
jgi:Carboxypeptidase regulatory-like domain